MLSSVLRSDIAVQTSVLITRAFVAMRQMIANSPVIMSAQHQKEMKELKEYIEDVFADQNDINEDTRMQIELINQVLAELQVHKKHLMYLLLVDYQYYTLKTVEKWQNRFCVDTKNVRFNVFNFWLHQNYIDMDWMGAFEPTP